MTYSYDRSPDRHARLLEAHEMAMALLTAAEGEGLFRAGVSELELSREIQSLGRAMFGTFKHWHKRIVRAGPNTLSTFGDTPPDLRIQADDIVFVDLGPMFETWEADIGRTYVIGDDPEKVRLRDAIETAWYAGRDHFKANRGQVTGADMYELAVEAARANGYRYANWHAGHLIGNFPHEVVQGELRENYLHPGNRLPLSGPDRDGNPRTWIYEVHFVDPERGYGGFFEQWLELEGEGRQPLHEQVRPEAKGCRVDSNISRSSVPKT
ncbi:MAG TPA: M24 family metallopeptidase [Allosphingosinicella sp.]|nr:M24 family metallopeptidase [Allosphingosinicella sp.]